jgi:ADP-ribosylglycohydrolase
MNKSLLYKKIYGCLAGGAIGDAMGNPFENKHYKDIEKKYGRVTDFIEGVHSYDVTDDTRMEHLLIKAMVAKKGRVTAKDLGDVWLKHPICAEDFWWDVRACICMVKWGMPPRLAGEGHSIGAGPMFIPPVGIINAGDPAQAALDAPDVACITQSTWGVDSASVIAAAVAEAMKFDATVDSVIQCAIDIGSDMPIIPEWGSMCKETIGGAIEKAVNIARKHPDVFELREPLYREYLDYYGLMAWWYIDWWIPFAMVQASGGDPKKAIIGGAVIGRDADTISRLAGSICGALKGIDAIPNDWLERIEKAVEAEKAGKGYIDKPLSQVAEDLVEVVKEHSKRLEDNIIQIRKLL